MKKIAGIGSRSTPADILFQMENIGEFFAKKGWLLRSGGADGADTAFEKGFDRVASSRKEIFLPWKKFNKNLSSLYDPSAEAFDMASKIHPAWGKCSPGARALHARNCHQVLGKNLDDPVDLLVCWTLGGGVSGGTATAIKIAKKHKIKTINLFDEYFEPNDFIEAEPNNMDWLEL